jgi:hypothetical protein
MHIRSIAGVVLLQNVDEWGRDVSRVGSEAPDPWRAGIPAAFQLEFQIEALGCTLWAYRDFKTEVLACMTLF